MPQVDSSHQAADVTMKCRLFSTVVSKATQNHARRTHFLSMAKFFTTVRVSRKFT